MELAILQNTLMLEAQLKFREGKIVAIVATCNGFKFRGEDLASYEVSIHSATGESIKAFEFKSYVSREENEKTFEEGLEYIRDL